MVDFGKRKPVLKIHTRRTSTMQKSFIIRVARLWNKLPDKIRVLSKHTIFKKLYFDFLNEQNSNLFSLLSVRKILTDILSSVAFC